MVLNSPSLEFGIQLLAHSPIVRIVFFLQPSILFWITGRTAHVTLGFQRFGSPIRMNPFVPIIGHPMHGVEVQVLIGTISSEYPPNRPAGLLDFARLTAGDSFLWQLDTPICEVPIEICDYIVHCATPMMYDRHLPLRISSEAAMTASTTRW